MVTDRADMIGMLAIAAIFVCAMGASVCPAQSLEEETRDENILESVLVNSDDASDMTVSVDINEAGEDELMSIPGMSTLCAAAIVSYRKEKGFIHVLTEISGIAGMTPEIFSSLQRYAEIRVRKTLRVDALSYLSISPQRSPLYGDAYSEAGVLNFQKLHVAYGDMEAFMVTDKDPGENSYTDFASISVSLGNFWIFSDIVAGDYALGLGDGLLFSRGGMVSKSAGPVTPLFKSNSYSLRPYRSKGENRFLRGAAVAIPLGNLTFTAFGSRKHLAARVNDSGEVVSVDYSGLHLPGGPQRADLGERIAGGVIRYESGRASLGFSGVHFAYDRTFYGSYMKDVVAWESFARLRLDNVMFSGEVLLDRVASFDAGVMLDYDDARFGLGLRNLGSQVLQNYGGALCESYPSNCEKGIYFGATLRPADRIKLGFYYDRFRIISRSGAPDRNGEEIFVDSYVPLSGNGLFGGKSTVIYVRYKFKTKEDTYLPLLDIPAALSVIAGSKQSARIDFRHRFTSAMSFRLRAERNMVSTGEKGDMLLFDSGWHLGKANLDMRVCFYRTDSYASAFYVVEKDLPHVSEFTLLYGDGARLFVLGSWKMNSSVTAGMKISRDIYSREREISVGKASGSFPGATDVSVEIRYSFE